MIQFKILYYYPAASWVSSLPCLGLEVRARPAEIKALLAAHRFLAAVVEPVPGFRNDRLLKPDTPWTMKHSGEWFALWLEVLLAAAGIPQVVPPELVSQRMAADNSAWSARLRCQCQSSEARLLEALLRWSLDYWRACAAQPRPADAAESLAQRLQLLVGNNKLKSSFLALAREVHRRGLPFEFDCAGSMDMLWVGLGANSQRFSQKATDQTSAWGLQCAKSKVLTRQLLQASGLPVARGGAVPDLDSALRLAEQIGYPVVSKPAAADQGQGVITLIADAETLREAWQESSSHGSHVLIEKHIPGRDYRFLVVDGSLIAALERLPGGVRGDGVHSVEQLIDQENDRRPRSPVTVEGGTKISLASLKRNPEAEVMLAHQGLTLASIPADGQDVRLRYSANFSVGGSVRECMAEVHPSTRLMLEKIARLFSLDIVGIDVLAKEIREPLQSQGGVICEVNGLPGVMPHMLAEPDRAVMSEILDKLLKPVSTVPVVAVHGEAADALISAIEAAVLPALPGLTVGCRSGARQGGMTLSEQDASTQVGQRPLLRDPAAAALLLQLDGRDLCAHGVSCARPDLLILSQPGSDPLPEPWKSWLCRSARRLICCDPAGPAPVTSLQQAQQVAIATLMGTSA